MHPNDPLGCICATKGFCNVEELFWFFLQCIVTLFGVTHFPRGKGKNELIFFDREDLNFLQEGYECRIPLYRKVGMETRGVQNPLLAQTHPS